jgi:hypothetical protein
LIYLSDNFFYIKPIYISVFLEYGPFKNDDDVIDNAILDKRHFTITVDEVQQFLMYNSITADDYDSLILLDVECNDFPFTLGQVVDVDDELVTLELWISSSNNILGPWSIIPNFMKQYPKSFCFCKAVQLTQKNMLKKRFYTIISNKYNN